MATITVKINERTNFGKAFLALLEVGISEKKIEVIKVPNADTLKSMANIEAGIGLTKTKNHADLMKKLNS
jgi:hypothetical protein